MAAPIVKRVFPVDPAQLLPAITPDNEPFWSALAQGRLQLQECTACAKTRYPIAPACPYCGNNGSQWRELSGRGTIFSYCRYHRSYLPEFEDLMPYVVACVQLDSGPRMFGRLLGRNVQPRVEQPVTLAIEQWPDGRCVACFELEQ